MTGETDGGDECEGDGGDECEGDERESDESDEPPVSGADVRGMIQHLRPEWRVRDWTPADEGTDFVCFVDAETPTGPREAVLKVCQFLDPVAFRPEPRVLELVNDRTDILAPSVIASCDDHGDLPAPFFLMDRLHGEQISGPESGDPLPNSALSRLAHEAGRNLADLHEATSATRSAASWDGYGWVRCAEDVDRATDPAVPQGLAVDDPTDDWRDAVRASTEGFLDRFPDRFSDLEAPLRDAVISRIDDVPANPEPVLTHCDYRYGNLLLDPETGETQAVLDWGNHSVGDPVNDLVWAENYLSGWDDGARRNLVRDSLAAGYREIRPLDVDPVHRDFYLLQTRLAPLAWFDLWYGENEAAEAIAVKHRTFVSKYL